jgi:hypothetical protein
VEELGRERCQERRGRDELSLSHRLVILKYDLKEIFSIPGKVDNMFLLFSQTRLDSILMWKKSTKIHKHRCLEEYWYVSLRLGSQSK